MERRSLGRSAIDVSILGLGGAPLGGLFKPSSSAAALATIRAAVAAGINLIDVAPHYGQGVAELRVGESLAALPDAAVVLSTKVGRVLEPSAETVSRENWPEALAFTTVYDTTASGIRRSAADSTRRLGGRRPDILLLHDPDRYADGADLRRMIEQSYATLSALRFAGETRAIGIGVNAPEACRIALDVGDWDCFLLAGAYSVLRQEDKGLLDLCLLREVTVLIGGPYMSGALAGGTTWRYRAIPPDVEHDIGRLRDVCSRYGVPMQAAALQFPLQHPAVASVIVGMRSPEELRDNIGYLAAPIPAELWADLGRAGLIPERRARPSR